MISFLADTGPLFALVNPSDRHHDQARRQLQRIQSTRRGLVLIQPILMESYSLILRRLGRKAAGVWLREVQSGASLLNPTDGDYWQAQELVSQYSDQSITLFDATLAVLSKRLKWPVWTFDFHFDVLQTEVLRDL